MIPWSRSTAQERYDPQRSHVDDLWLIVPYKSDVFEVTLDVSATRSVALLPQEIYDCQSALVLELPEFGVHLRNHDYFMGKSQLLRVEFVASLRLG